ncbi:MAG: hypothetical protein A3F40_04390 [Chlamydiae bacterium RIFCSPHIGHO2_12_FULL_27_8]|nr:MAG: hypothetical protein A3F40_04390 [Chlamydiae bacterium RIFCSPHIGHO2_12_FULL_27_8]
MKIFNSFNNRVCDFIEKFDENIDILTKKNNKKAAVISLIYKITAIVMLIFVKSFPPIFITSIYFISLSFYIDYKIMTNIEPLIYCILDKSINDEPYKKGYYEGSFLGRFLKGLPERAKGFKKGFVYEYYSK